MEYLEIMPIRAKVSSVLRKAIYSGEYKSGQELSLTDVSQRLGVSRTPVREAFLALSAEGLLTLRMNKGAIVNRIDEKFICDCYDMRILLESRAAFLAARNGAEVDELLSRAYSMRDCCEAPDTDTYEALNQDIHLTLWNAADNERLKHYLMELWNGPSTGSARTEHYRASTLEHIAVLEAVRDRDCDAAAASMSGHIERSRDNILSMLRE